MNYLLLFGGQSNMEGAGAANYSGFAPAGIPNANVRFASRTSLGSGAVAAGELRVDPVNNHFGPELKCAQDCYEAGWTSLTVAKGAYGGQPITQFLPGGSYYWYLKDSMMRALQPKLGPTTAYFIWNQGEAETIEVAETNALLWASRYNTLHAIVEGWAGQTMPKIICRTSNKYHIVTGDAAWMNTVRAQQASVADYLIDTDDFTFQGDDAHYIPSDYNVLGSRISSVLLSL